MLPLCLLLVGILVLLLLQSFSLYHRVIPIVVLSIVLGFTMVQDKLFIAVMQSMGILITMWVLYAFDQDDEPFTILILFSLLGGMVAIDAQDWLKLYIGLELMALPLYALSALNRDQVLAREAALKYFVMGAIASLFILYGISFIYMATGSLAWGSYKVVLIDYHHIGWVLVFTGIFVKLGLVPFHSWVPDIYQTIPLGVLAWVAMVPKIVYLSIIFKIMTIDQLPFLSHIIQYISSISIVYGSVMAIMQSNLRRLLAYASIAHLGIMVLPLMFYQLGFNAALFYLCVYIAMNLSLFACLNILESMDIHDIKSLKSLGYKKHYEAFLFMLTLISMAGIPPLVGFFAKLNVLFLLMTKAAYISAFTLVFSAIVSAYYYMNLIRLMYHKNKLSEGGSSIYILIYALPLMLLSIIPSSFLVWLNIVLNGI